MNVTIDEHSDPNRGWIDRKFQRSLTDEDIERMADEDPDSNLELDWSTAKVVLPEPKTSIHLRADADMLAWFRSQGRGYLTRMNAVLRTYYQARRRQSG